MVLTARHRLGVGLMLVLIFVLADVAGAQSRYVRFEGRVQWIGGNVLSLALNDGPSVAIDLTRVSQSDYSALVQGDWVLVQGELSPDRRRIFGSEITRTYSSTQAP